MSLPDSPWRSWKRPDRHLAASGPHHLLTRVAPPENKEHIVANDWQLELIRRDVDEWNLWRQARPDITPDLSHADLSRADLAVADLSGAVLAGASLVMANLCGADLSQSDLSGANLVGARLLGVDLSGADLSGADLRTAEDLTQEQINETEGNEHTVLPESVRPPHHWRIR